MANSYRRKGKLEEGPREAEGTSDALSESEGSRDSELGGSAKQESRAQLLPFLLHLDISGLDAGGKSPLGGQR